MPAISFSPQFAALVESGQKTQTIRAPRKVPIRVGDHLYLYTGMRTKACRKLGEGEVSSVRTIRIEDTGRSYLDGSRLGDYGRLLTIPERNQLAKNDGFRDWPALWEWFDRTHGFPFRGHLIRWRLLPRAEWRRP